MMCQHSTKISGRLNIMLISTTMQLQNGLQLAQMNAGPATVVVFERPHLHNKTEITFPNFGLLQKRQGFQLKGENQFHLTCLFSTSMELQKRKSSDDGGC